jgi:hypothetical protein
MRALPPFPVDRRPFHFWRADERGTRQSLRPARRRPERFLRSPVALDMLKRKGMDLP